MAEIDGNVGGITDDGISAEALRFAVGVVQAGRFNAGEDLRVVAAQEAKLAAKSMNVGQLGKTVAELNKLEATLFLTCLWASTPGELITPR